MKSGDDLLRLFQQVCDINTSLAFYSYLSKRRIGVVVVIRMNVAGQ